MEACTYIFYHLRYDLQIHYLWALCNRFLITMNNIVETVIELMFRLEQN